VSREAVEVRGSPIHGVGVFAKRPIRRGEWIFAFDDSRIVDDEHPLDAARGEAEAHCDWFPGHVTLMGEPERYLNHRCEPNSYAATDDDGLRWLVASRDIGAGDEITQHYLIDAFGGDRWDRRCGDALCRREHVHDSSRCPTASIALSVMRVLAAKASESTRAHEGARPPPWLILRRGSLVLGT
jgi:hypothetical protein